MDRFFIDGDLQVERGDELRLSERESHHARVKRLAAGDRVRVFDAGGREAEAVVARFERSGAAVLEVVAVEVRGAAPAVPVTVGLAFPKGKRALAFLEKATELGIAAVVPLVTRRTVGGAREERSAGRREKWRAATIEAAKQSGAWRPPEIEAPRDFADVVARPAAAGELRIILHPGEGAHPLREVLARPRPAAALLLVGPEGGFDEDEVAAARAAGFEAARLGPTILRIETAAIAAIAAITVAYE
jgi:16S rRNA (uracil1498-N3)-methyltransferase